MLQVQSSEATKRPPLQYLPAVHHENGPPLPVGQQLRRCAEPETLSPLPLICAAAVLARGLHSWGPFPLRQFAAVVRGRIPPIPALSLLSQDTGPRVEGAASGRGQTAPSREGTK